MVSIIVYFGFLKIGCFYPLQLYSISLTNLNIFIYNNLFSDFKSVSPVTPLDYTPILVSVLVAVVLIVVGEL